MNQFYISFDDTDTLDSPGTGHLLEGFLGALPGKSSFISRHQLFVSSAVPYTSHNSAMCAVVTGELTAEELIAAAAAYLERETPEGSDPGLCVADLSKVTAPEKLTLWGYRAKREVLTKEEAVAVAAACGVHLSEHGGTGQGIVGALAAVGLRIAGQDGRVKGKKTVSRPTLTVKELLSETGFDRVSAYGEGELPPDAVVFVGEEMVKAVYQDFRSTVLTVKEGDHYRLLTKDQLKCY